MPSNSAIIVSESDTNPTFFPLMRFVKSNIEEFYPFLIIDYHAFILKEFSNSLYSSKPYGVRGRTIPSH